MTSPAALLLALSLQSTPLQQIDMAEGPVAALFGSGHSLVIPRLFPASEASPNLLVLDRSSFQIRSQFTVGRRLFDAGLFPRSARNGSLQNGDYAVVALGDQDFVLLVDLTNGSIVREYAVGKRPGGITVSMSAQGTPYAAVANGSSRDVSLINLRTDRVETLTGIGRDPRDVAFHPDGQHLLIAVGGEDELVVYDLQSREIRSRLAVGSNPVDVEISPDGRRAVVANIGSNSVSVIGIADLNNPFIRKHVLAGNEPSSVAMDDQNRAYVANSHSGFVTVIDTEANRVLGALTVERNGQIVPALASVEISPDLDRLSVVERGNVARILTYDLPLESLQPLPEFSRPGEPSGSLSLGVDPTFACPGYYTAVVSQEAHNSARAGSFGFSGAFANPQTRLQGAVTIAAAYGEDGKSPGFAAFAIGNRNNEPQTLDVEALLLDDDGAALELVGPGGEILATGSGTGNTRQFSTVVDPGFYRIRVKSLPGGTGGSFDMQVTTRFVDRAGGGFTGGLNFGGYIAEDPEAMAAANFCIAEPAITRVSAKGASSLGDTGAGALRIEILDRSRQSVRSIHSVPQQFPLPTAESLDNTQNLDLPVTHYVDATTSRLLQTGSFTYPYKSLTAVIDNIAETGDVIRVAEGVYRARPLHEDFPIASRGIGKDPIRPGVKIIGAGVGKAIIDVEQALQRNGNNLHAFVIGADDVHISGLTIRGATASGIFVLDANNVVIENNEFIDNRRSGVSTFNASGVVVRNNLFHRNDENGIVLSASRKTSAPAQIPDCPEAFGACVVGNYFADHRVDGILASQGGDYYIADNIVLRSGVAGIELNNRTPEGQQDMELEGAILNNTVVANGGVQFAFAGSGILVTEHAVATAIADNIVSYNEPSGIAIFEDGHANLLQRNEVHDNDANGIIIRKRSSVDEASHNAISGNGLAGIVVDEDSQAERITENLFTANGRCDDCTASRAGLAVLGMSEVATVDANTWVGNRLGIQLSNQSSIGSVTNAVLSATEQAAILLSGASTLTVDGNTEITGSPSDQPVITLTDSSASLTSMTVHDNQGTGLAAFNSAVDLVGSEILSNGVDGIAAHEGSIATVNDSHIVGNRGHGVLATGAETRVEISNSRVEGNGRRGVNASQDAFIQCVESQLGDNTLGDVFGNTDCGS